jgi:hypothetical protein
MWRKKDDNSREDRNIGIGECDESSWLGISRSEIAGETRKGLERDKAGVRPVNITI